MNKFVLLIITSLTLSVSFSASARVACEDLRGEIATKIMNNGVPESGFRLDVMVNELADQAVQNGGQIVGSCDGGTSKIIYTRFLNGERNAAAETATPSRPVTGERLADDAHQVAENPQNAQMVDSAQNTQAVEPSQNAQMVVPSENVQAVEPAQSAQTVVPSQNVQVVEPSQNGQMVVPAQNAPATNTMRNSSTQMAENRQIGQLR